MERDKLGWRARIGVVAPATNTIVQPEMEAMRPDGVTNHLGRIRVTNVPMATDADFIKLLDALDADMDRALDDVAAAAPDHMIIGVTSPMLRGGRASCDARLARLEERTGIAMTAGSTALARVLAALGLKRIGLITPYQPVMDQMLTDFFTGEGVSVAHLVTLRCPTPFAIAQVPQGRLSQEIEAGDRPEIEAWVQVGTNLAFTGFVPALTEQVGKPVIGVNAVTYWEALRRVGITEDLPALGPILGDLPYR
ncbi:maleate cis-trans isomerase family protein [Flavimaricola marinus]|uniref:Maleate isomerase n=1 Tax=Flavimaricola marinus TaxID=1819565 RepID=A0A238LEL6_9RHOB|nr:hypothetical protein [Flavimaricola marinus]SMY08157.1 Maleate isomerase [Flavimaricola marinus]